MRGSSAPTRSPGSTSSTHRPGRSKQVGRLWVMTDQRSMTHVDPLQRIAVPVALLAMVIGSAVAGSLMGDLDWMIVVTSLSVATGIIGFLWGRASDCCCASSMPTSATLMRTTKRGNSPSMQT